MYCNITQLSVKKKHKRNKNYLFMYSSLLGSTFPTPSYPWAKMCTRFCQYLKDSSAQLYDPIYRFSPGLGKDNSPG